MDSHESILAFLAEHKARHAGTDRQVDTYFRVPDGRLKIRQGTVEACIVQYNRPDTDGMRHCEYRIEKYAPGDPALENIRTILAATIGVLVTVVKIRDIHFIGNAKFHLDRVEDLGDFFEIEIIGGPDDTAETLERSCADYLTALGIGPGDLIGESYSDMVLRQVQQYE